MATPDTSAPVVSVLLVAPERSDHVLLLEALRGLNIVVAEAGDFHQATATLASTPPDVLITELRLGAYNGLHLVLRAKATAPRTKAIVLARSADPVLQREAARFEAEFLVTGSNEAWTASIVAAIESFLAGRPTLALRPAEGARGG